jgi:WD repeat-containing protein 68
MAQTPAAELIGHNACVNSISWAPHSSCHIATAADDAQALIWEVTESPKIIEEPALAYQAESEINQLSWQSLQPDWIAIAFGEKIQLLKV